MNISSVLCREQEAIQRQRAATSTLANVRLVAERAAAAWSIEAKAAEAREARQQRSLLLKATESGDEAGLQDNRNRGLSENPDRGCPTPAVSVG